MRLIDQKQILTLDPFTEEPAQMRIRVKHVIIVADDRVHPQRDVQTHLMRAYLPFPRLLRKDLPIHLIRRSDQLVHRVIHPVIMPLRIRAGVWITVRLLTKTDLLLSGQHDDLHTQALLP